MAVVASYASDADCDGMFKDVEYNYVCEASHCGRWSVRQDEAYRATSSRRFRWVHITSGLLDHQDNGDYKRDFLKATVDGWV